MDVCEAMKRTRNKLIVELSVVALCACALIAALWLINEALT